MQQESNACVRPGLEVYYVASDKRTYRAMIRRELAHERCDLTVYGNVDGQHPGCITAVYQVGYDSEGEPHSWHKRSDILPEGTELTPGRTLARDVPIIIEKD